MQKYSKNCYNMAKYCHNRNSFETDIQKNVSCPVNYIYPILCSKFEYLYRCVNVELNLCALLSDCATALFSAIKVSV